MSQRSILREIALSSGAGTGFQYSCAHRPIRAVFMKIILAGTDGALYVVDMNAHTEVELNIQAGESVTVTWTGRAADRRPGAVLNPVFDQLLAIGQNLVFDLSGLEHMSSSTMVVIMKFVKQVNAAGIAIAIEYDESVSWQRMMFASLVRMAAPAPAWQQAA
jgi:hypothetical protein